MSEPDFEPFSPEIDALLRRERSAAVPEAEVARALARMDAAVALAGAAGVAADVVRPAVKTGIAGAIASKPIAAALIAALAGGAIGSSATYLTLSAREPAKVVVIERAAPAPADAPSSSSNAPWVPVPVPTTSDAPPARPRPLPSSTAATSSGADSAAERLLLETARAAIGRGDGKSALAALDQHGRRYPNGDFAEEREALAVQALVQSGAPDAAKTRGARFHKQYPHSMFGPSVDAALGTIP